MAILPVIGSGNFADPRQARDFVDPTINFGVEVAGFDGKGINKYYPSPKEYRYGTADGSTAPSGVFISYPPSLSNPAYITYDGRKGTGIFNFKEFISDFSNAPASKAATDGINNFTIFNPYIHHLDSNGHAVKIPFVSDVIPTSNVFDRYGSLKAAPED